MKYLSLLDPHVHLRGAEYPNHDFLGMGLRDAAAVGLAGVLEMPNTTPWLTTESIVKERLESVKRREFDEIYHGINVGITTDRSQVVKVSMSHWKGVHAFKIFFAGSTNSMTCSDPDYQKWVWRSISTGYLGTSRVVIGHFEDETKYVGKFDPADPISHSRHQTPFAELQSIETQLKNAIGAGFRGTFYIAHLTCPAALDLVRFARRLAPFKIVVEVTWHHLLLNTNLYAKIGNRAKCNPPLRSPEVQESLLVNLLSRDDIDIIATDHAPHPIERKDDPVAPASGLPGLPFWPRGIQLLRNNGMSEQRIADLTFHNANRVFNLGLTPREVDKEYNPELWVKYGYNPYEYFGE